jgi:uncharacterized protein (TIGR02246 family)
VPQFTPGSSVPRSHLIQASNTRVGAIAAGVVLCLAVGCAPAGSVPQSRIGSLAVEPELPDATTASADPHRLAERTVPEVIGKPRPFRLGDVVPPGRTGEAVATLGLAIEPLSEFAGIRPVAALEPVAEPARLPADESSTAAGAEIHDMLSGYLRAFNRHDAAAAAAHWTADGENVNLDSGEVTRGREAVREVFTALFEIDPEATIDIDVTAVRPVRGDVAVVDGVSRVSYADGEVAGSRFSAVVVREADHWRLASVRETPAVAPAAPARPLEQLAWLVGSWEDVGEGVIASSQAAWTGDRAFLVRRHLITPDAVAAATPAAGDQRIPGLLPAGGTARRELTEIIGWDPERESIRCWIFSSDGRFAEGMWSKDGPAWTVRVEGRGLDAGREATCTLTADGPDGLVIQTEGESLAGLLPPACGFTRTAR